MMNQVQIELARKLVAHERWEWKVGMLATGSSGGMDGSIRLWWPVTRHKGERGPIGIHSGGNTWPISMHGPYLPDLTDDATAGVLLGMWLETMEVYPLCEALAKAASFAFSLPNATTAEAFALMLLADWSSQ
jgi:hypothetical protein